MYDDEKKDEILQRVHDLLEEYDWGGSGKKVVIKLTFRGRFWMADPEIIIREDELLTEKTPVVEWR